MLNGIRVSFFRLRFCRADAQNKNLVLTCTTTGNIYLYDFGNGSNTPVRAFNNHTSKSTLSWSNFYPNVFFSGSMDQKIYMWDYRENKPTSQYKLNGNKVKHIMCDPFSEYQFAAGYSDKTVRVWDFRYTHKTLVSYSPHLMEVTYLDWHPTEKNVLLSGG